jgi:hypothetical protein
VVVRECRVAACDPMAYLPAASHSRLVSNTAPAPDLRTRARPRVLSPELDYRESGTRCAGKGFAHSRGRLYTARLEKKNIMHAGQHASYILRHATATAQKRTNDMR